jgi:hypothetical protein
MPPCATRIPTFEISGYPRFSMQERSPPRDPGINIISAYEERTSRFAEGGLVGPSAKDHSLGSCQEDF